MTPEEIIKRIEIPDWDTVSSIKQEEASFIYHFLDNNKIKKTLEIGFAFGMSASHIIASTGSQHIVCDPFQDNYKNIGLSNIENLGLIDKLEFHPDYSHNLLPELLKRGNQFDFIFIDGDHKFDNIMVDFYYSDLILSDNGYILLHDTWMRSTRLVEGFIKRNRNNFRKIRIPHKNLLLLRKNGKDERDGIYFREFYNLKSLIKHSLIRWLSGSRQKYSGRVFTKNKSAE